MSPAPVAPAADAPAGARKPGQRPAPGAQRTRRPNTLPGEPTNNLGVRIRRSVDERLSQLIVSLRADGVRSSKAELIEMLLWQLPPAADDSLRAELRSFREAAPRDAL